MWKDEVGIFGTFLEPCIQLGDAFVPGCHSLGLHLRDLFEPSLFSLFGLQLLFFLALPPAQDRALQLFAFF